MSSIDPIKLLRSHASTAGSMRKLALKIGVSAPYLSDVMNGHRMAGQKVLKYLGLRRSVTRQVQYFRDPS